MSAKAAKRELQRSPKRAQNRRKVRFEIETRKETEKRRPNEILGEVKSNLYVELYAFFGFGTFARRTTNITNICIKTLPKLAQKVSPDEVKKQPRKSSGKKTPMGQGLERKWTPKGSEKGSTSHPKKGSPKSC